MHNIYIYIQDYIYCAYFLDYGLTVDLILCVPALSPTEMKTDHRVTETTGYYGWYADRNGINTDWSYGGGLDHKTRST